MCQARQENNSNSTGNSATHERPAGVKGVPDKPPHHTAPASPTEHQRGLPAHRLAGNASSTTLEVSARGMSSWESEGYTGGCSTQAFRGNPSRLGESTLQDEESYIKQRLCGLQNPGEHLKAIYWNMLEMTPDALSLNQTPAKRTTVLHKKALPGKQTQQPSRRHW